MEWKFGTDLVLSNSFLPAPGGSTKLRLRLSTVALRTVSALRREAACKPLSKSVCRIDFPPIKTVPPNPAGPRLQLRLFVRTDGKAQEDGGEERSAMEHCTGGRVRGTCAASAPLVRAMSAKGPALQNR